MSDKKPISDKALAVCSLITRGYSVQKACAELHYGTDTFYDELRSSEALSKEYVNARETRADTRFENMQTILDECKAGLIDSNTARVLIDAIKWQTGKEKAKVYGEKQTIDHTGNITLSKLVEDSMLALPAKEEEVLELTAIHVKADDFI